MTEEPSETVSSLGSMKTGQLYGNMIVRWDVTLWEQRAWHSCPQCREGSHLEGGSSQETEEGDLSVSWSMLLGSESPDCCDPPLGRGVVVSVACLVGHREARRCEIKKTCFPDLPLPFSSGFGILWGVVSDSHGT